MARGRQNGGVGGTRDPLIRRPTDRPSAIPITNRDIHIHRGGNESSSADDPRVNIFNKIRKAHWTGLRA